MASISKSLSARPNSFGEFEVLLEVIIARGKKIRLKSGVFVRKEHFNPKTHKFVRLRGFTPEKDEAEKREKEVAAIEEKLLNRCREIDTEAITKEDLMDAIGLGAKGISASKGSLGQSPDLSPTATDGGKATQSSEFFDAYASYLSQKNIVEGTSKTYGVLERGLKRFEAYKRLETKGGFALSLNGFDNSLSDELYDFLRNEGRVYRKYPQIYEALPYDTRRQHKRQHIPEHRSDNTLVSLFKKLGAFFHWCNACGLSNCSPALKTATGESKIKEEYGDPWLLTREERDHIAGFDLTRQPKIAIQRDIFIFQCLTGMRISDLYSLTPESVKRSGSALFVEYIPQKTKKDRAKVVRVPLTPQAAAIMERYKGADRKGRLFPFIASQSYNEHIKVILTICGVTRKVAVLNPITREIEHKPLNEIGSSHMARRTFIGLLYKETQDPNLIGSMSGHVEGSKAFARYRSIDDNIKLDLIRRL